MYPRRQLQSKTGLAGLSGSGQAALSALPIRGPCEAACSLPTSTAAMNRGCARQSAEGLGLAEPATLSRA
jgi:hypothetical protein